MMTISSSMLHGTADSKKKKKLFKPHIGVNLKDLINFILILIWSYFSRVIKQYLMLTPTNINI